VATEFVATFEFAQGNRILTGNNRREVLSVKGSRGLPRAAATAAGVLVAGKLSAVEPSKKLAAVLEKIPSGKGDDAFEIGKALAAGGPAMVRELVGLVGEEFGDPAGVKAKYALHGLVAYVARPGGDRERKMVAETLAAQLQGGHSAELKAFVVRQLQLCAGPDQVGVLGKLLGDERLCEPATQALLAMGDDESAAALREALVKVKGKRRVTILQALGRLRDAGSAEGARKAAGANDRDLRLAGLYALGSMGDAASAAVVLKASNAQATYERSQATAACLLLARALAARGEGKEAGKVLRNLLAGRQAKQDVHDRCAALATLADVLGQKAVGDVMEALGSDELAYRVPAARTAVKLAASVQAGNRGGADKLLKKVMKATDEQAVLRKAQELLAKAAKGVSS